MTSAFLFQAAHDAEQKTLQSILAFFLLILLFFRETVGAGKVLFKT